MTSNKHLPFQSLANSMVRDSTSYYHRWMYGRPWDTTPTLTEVIITCMSHTLVHSLHCMNAYYYQVSGKAKEIEVDGNVSDQIILHR